MNTAVLTAYSPNFARVANLCVPSHKYFAARNNFDFFELTVPEDGQHNWHKLDLIQRYLITWHAVIWIDADCFVPYGWQLPPMVNGCRYAFPRTTELGTPHYWHFMGYWRNDAHSFNLLNGMMAMKGLYQNDALADQRALNEVLLSDATLRDHVTSMDRGLVHFHGIPTWEKVSRLKAVLC